MLNLLIVAIMCNAVLGLGPLTSFDPFNTAGEQKKSSLRGKSLSSTNCPLPDNGWTPAWYVNTSAFTQTCVSVVNGDWTMSGALTMPVGSGPFPAIVIIGGSGPTDMDSSNGVNKMLKDLAWGLSSKGIAVLRFNKRTFQYGTWAFPDGNEFLFTIAQEYTNDALAALTLLRSHKKVDKNKIILAGHSLGAEVASHIAQLAHPSVNGVLLLAATSTNLPDLIPWQYYYLSGYSPAWGEMGVQCRNLINNATLTPTSIVNCYAINAQFSTFNSYGNYYLSERTYDT